MKFFIYAHNPYSEGAKALAEHLKAKRIKHEGSRYRPKRTDVVINWGSSRLPTALADANVLNLRSGVASDKLQSFNALKAAAVSVPDFTTIKEEATWDEGVARTILNGSSGAGIVLWRAGEEIPRAPLYVQYVKKKHEFRVHVLKGKIIHVQQKKLKNGFEANKIRSHDNGYVFAVNDIQVPENVKSEAIKAVAALALDFGAVDVIYNEKQERAYVLEVNTAPGLCETTATKYADAFKEEYAT